MLPGLAKHVLRNRFFGEPVWSQLRADYLSIFPHSRMEGLTSPGIMPSRRKAHSVHTLWSTPPPHCTLWELYRLLTLWASTLRGHPGLHSRNTSLVLKELVPGQAPKTREKPCLKTKNNNKKQTKQTNKQKTPRNHLKNKNKKLGSGGQPSLQSKFQDSQGCTEKPHLGRRRGSFYGGG